jgi:hypothetical protein
MGHTYAITPATIRKERKVDALRREGRLCAWTPERWAPLGCSIRATYQIVTTESNGYSGRPMSLCTRHARELERSLAYHGRTNPGGQTFGPLELIAAVPA